MTLVRPMFPPRADSSHSFPGEPASQQRKRRKAIQRVSKLRQKASDEIERLLAFLDASDPYVMTEREPDGDELDASFRETGPKLGWDWSLRGGDAHEDAEEDDPAEQSADDEPSLGSLDNHDQRRWGYSDRRDLEEQCEDEGSAA